MKHEGKILVNRQEAEELERFCKSPPGRDNCLGKDVPLYDEDFAFPDGNWMVVQVVPSTDPDHEACWTQGVLFSVTGAELACTEVGESFLGEYHISHGGNEYVVQVEAGDVPRTERSLD